MMITLLFSAWDTLWPQERKRQRAFFLFGLALILQLDIEGIRTFFHTFFRLPSWYDLNSSYLYSSLRYLYPQVICLQCCSIFAYSGLISYKKKD